jgi:flagellar basal-body rod modification protein FlgD
MATTNPLTATQELINSFNQAGKQSSAADGLQDRFLKLLVTQMKNQDPLNPLDNAQVTTQLAQISTVTGVDKLNKTLADMSSAFLSAQSLQATNLIGHSVLAGGNALQLQGSAAVGGVQLAEPADKLTITVRGSAGELVRTIDLAAQDAGLRSFSWDGKTDAGGHATDGKYTFEATAVRGGKKVDAQALGVALVQSVSLGGGEVQLNTSSLGAVPISQVKQIL